MRRAIGCRDPRSERGESASLRFARSRVDCSESRATRIELGEARIACKLEIRENIDKRGRATRTTVVLLGLSLVLMGRGGSSAKPGDPPRIVVLGFDGVDAQIVQSMLAAGRLPNLAALKQRGGYSPLIPTIPAQTPVSWATFSTGLDPGGHEIFDFLKRNPADRIPTFAVAEDGEMPPSSADRTRLCFRQDCGFCLPWPGQVSSSRAAGCARSSFATWSASSLPLPAFSWSGPGFPRLVPSSRTTGKERRSGACRAAVRRPSCACRLRFRPDSFAQGHLLSGLGVPDLSGRIGQAFLLYVGSFLHAARGQRFLDRSRPSRLEHRPPGDQDRGAAGKVVWPRGID